MRFDADAVRDCVLPTYINGDWRESTSDPKTFLSGTGSSLWLSVVVQLGRVPEGGRGLTRSFQGQ